MDSLEEAQDYDDMDHAVVNRAFVRDLLDAAGDIIDAHQARLDREEDVPPIEVLDLGTGTAQIPIELCQTTDLMRVVGCDLATEMLDVAIRNVDIALLRQRIMLSHCDAKDLPFSDERFAIVMSNSIVHHIPDPLAVLREGIRVLADGGMIFVRDLLRPNTDEEVARLVELHAAECNPHQRAMFDASLRAALTLEEIRDLVQRLGFSPERVRVTSDRHWTWREFKNHQPSS